MNPELRFPPDELRVLRNQIPLHQLMQAFRIPIKMSEGYWRFPCPDCHSMNTAINPKTNLGRCFRCRKNFNTIDITMLNQKRCFVQAVLLLREIQEAIRPHLITRK